MASYEANVKIGRARSGMAISYTVEVVIPFNKPDHAHLSEVEKIIAALPNGLSEKVTILVEAEEHGHPLSGIVDKMLSRGRSVTLLPD